ncbi:TPA: hypothetical protein ACH3X1_011364 [Trebouxia sp. C0004]
MSDTRVKKFDKLLGEQVVDLDLLRELAWSGTPGDLRPLCWQLLLGYLPPNRDRREQILARKRREYRDMVPEYYDIANNDRSEEEMGALRQVSVDVPRTAPGVAFFHEAPVQKCLERILYIWGIRHPASGYVQGINDLVTPFLAALLSQHFDGPMELWDIETLSEETMYAVEADAYWMLCKMLDGIQDHYTNAQPGIQRTVFKLKELVRRIDEPMCQHMETEGLEFLQFSFRWVNCLLLREIPFQLGLRLWDTYLAEGPGMKEFLIYALAAFLLTWEKELKQMDFQVVENDVMAHASAGLYLYNHILAIAMPPCDITLTRYVQSFALPLSHCTGCRCHFIWLCTAEAETHVGANAGNGAVFAKAADHRME